MAVKRAKKTLTTKKPATIDDYLAKVSDEQRAVLNKLRKTIRAAAPQAEECISYGVPAYRQNGMLVGFGASSGHCSLFLMNGHTVAQFADDLAAYDTSKGTIRFSVDKPLPAVLVRKLLNARLAENDAKQERMR